MSVESAPSVEIKKVASGDFSFTIPTSWLESTKTLSTLTHRLDGESKNRDRKTKACLCMRQRSRKQLVLDADPIGRFCGDYRWPVL